MHDDIRNNQTGQVDNHFSHNLLEHHIDKTNWELQILICPCLPHQSDGAFKAKLLASKSAPKNQQVTSLPTHRRSKL
jgi:hypothetical protein